MKKYRNTEKLLRGRRGSVIVEAAVFLPLFLVSILTLGLLIRQAGIEETVFHSMLNQGRLASVSAYSAMQLSGSDQTAGGGGSEDGTAGGGDGIEGGTAGKAEDVEMLPGGITGLGSRQLFRAGVQTQLNKELKLDPETVALHKFHYLYQSDKRDYLIEAAVRYKIAVPLPRAVKEKISGGQHLVLRAFVGGQRRQISTDVQELETEKESCLVYVFPRTGERYHSPGCSTVTSQPVRCVLTAGLKRKYKACSLCGAENAGRGSAVYCFTGYGEAYHRRNCSAVEKYTVKMEKDEAIRQGYTACQKCGGG